MRAVPLLRYHLEPLKCLLIPRDVVQNFWAVFFDPGTHASDVVGEERERNLHTTVARKRYLVRLLQPGLRLKPSVARTSSSAAFVGQIAKRLHAFWAGKYSGEITESV